jgi:hypothetical protein
MIWLCALCLLASPAGAQAKMLMRITISGPGLTGEVEVTDEEVLHALFDLPAGIRLQEVPMEMGGAYYTIHQEVGDGDRVFAVNVYHYYHDPQGGPGYLLFADVINGSASVEGAWFQPDERTGQALQTFLAAHARPQPEAASGLQPGAVAWGAGVAGVLLAGVWLVLRRLRTPGTGLMGTG